MPFDALLGQQIAVFAKRDEDDAVEDLLGDVDGVVQRFLELEMQVLDQQEAVFAVRLVEFVADLRCRLSDLLQEHHARGAAGRAPVNKPPRLEQAIELAENFCVLRRS